MIADLHRLDRIHRAAIESCCHPHQADAGLVVAGEYRGLDRRGAAPARQDGAVHVQTAVCRHVEHRLRQDKSIGGDDQYVGLQRFELGNRFGRLQRPRLQHRDIVFERQRLHRARHDLLAASGRPVGLGQYGHRCVARVDQRGQRSTRELRCAGEEHPGSVHLLDCLQLRLVDISQVVQVSVCADNASSVGHIAAAAACRRPFSRRFRMRVRFASDR